MGVPEVHSLPLGDLEPFLDRKRYSAFAMSQLQLPSFLGEILKKANDFVPSEAGSILMDRPIERGETPSEIMLYFVAAFGPSSSALLGKSLRADRGIVGNVYRTGEPYVMADPENDPNFYSKFDEDHKFRTTGVVAVPVRIERTVCGVLELLNRSNGKPYTDRNLQMLEIFARYTSISIENLLDAQRATEMARRDDLTGLYNDRFFHHRLSEDLIRADVTRSTVALLFLDIDNFKTVNDTHGHLAGSQVLKEFGWLLTRAVTLEAGCEVAKRIQDELANTQFLQGSFSWSDGPVYWRQPLTSSIGIAVYPHHLPRLGTTDLKKNLLLRAADLAMYRGKENGKDQIRIAD
jgi:GGDEF domain-containing protein